MIKKDTVMANLKKGDKGMWTIYTDFAKVINKVD